MKITYAKSGVSLIELLLAILLLVLVMLAVSAVDIASKRHLREVDIRTTLYGEISNAMDMIKKNVSGAVGIYNNPATCIRYSLTTPPSCIGSSVNVQEERAVMYRRSDTTFSNLTDNNWGGFRFNETANEIGSFDYDTSTNSWNTSFERITRQRISTVVFRRGSGDNVNSLYVLIGAKEKPDDPTHPINNPEVIVESNIIINGMPTS